MTVSLKYSRPGRSRSSPSSAASRSHVRTHRKSRSGQRTLDAGIDPPIAHGGEESYRAYPTGPQDRYPLLIQFRHVRERDREKGHGIVDVPVPGRLGRPWEGNTWFPSRRGSDR